MRRDSVLIFSLSVLVTMGMVGGAYYFTVVQPIDEAAPRSAPENAARFAEPPPVGVSMPSTPQRTDQIIKCVDPDIGEFYTNARDCQSADLSNRLSSAQDFRSIDYLSPTPEEARQNLQRTTNNNPTHEPSLRRVAQAVPDDLSVSCKFAVGRALETERMLSAADDPAESIWREDYCEWVDEARGVDCGVSTDIFYYDHLCGYQY